MTCRFLWTTDTQQCFLVKGRIFYRLDPEVCRLLETSRSNPMVKEALRMDCDDTVLHKVMSHRYFINLNLHITERCNLRCKFCYMGDKSYTSDIPKDLVLSILDEFFEMGGLRVILTGGEPLLHPHIEEIARYIKHLGMQLIVKTNGTLPRLVRYSDIFDEVHISLFGNQPIYREISGKDMFDKVVANMEQLLEQRSKTGRPDYVQVTFTVVPENVHLLDKLHNLYPFNRHDINIVINPPIYSGAVRYKYSITEIKQIRKRVISYRNRIPNLQAGDKPSVTKYFPVQTCNAHTLTVTPPDKLVYCPFLKDVVYARLQTISLREAVKKIRAVNQALGIPEKVKEVGRGECLANHYFYDFSELTLTPHIYPPKHRD